VDPYGATGVRERGAEPHRHGSRSGPSQAAPDRLDRPFTDPLVQRIFPTLPTGVVWELGRTAQALARIGDPHLAYPTIHVGGTNGKGSVAATLASVLAAEGLRVGLYTSPHLVHFRERFQVAGRPLPDDVLAERAAEVRAAVVEGGLTFFEAATVLGFHAFAKAGVEVAVVEVGLGGRLDATNVLRPACAVLTNVAMDHADYLGPTLESIATEKAGIIKEGVPVLTAEADAGILELLRGIARARRAPFTALDPVSDLHHLDVSRGGTDFTVETRSWGALRLHTPLVGRHQALNAALAVEALEHLPERLRPDADAVRKGVASVRWPGRDQIEVAGDVTWLLDVAHNPAGVLSLVDVLDRLDFRRPLVALVGVLADKDWRAMLPPLFRRADLGVLTQPASAPPGRRWDPLEALEVVSASGGPLCTLVAEPDFARAFERARVHAKGGTVVVTGSVYTVGNTLQVLGRDPFPLA
jgi:dihydrofolate synthase/folylpolyglutamate synthase